MGVHLPGYSIATDLEELEDILSLLSVLGFLFGCQCVIGHQQRMVSSSYENGKKKKKTRTIYSEVTPRQWYMGLLTGI